MRGGNPEPQHVTCDRPAHRTRHQPAIVGAGITAVGAHLEHVARRAGNDVDRSPQRVFAIERTLRPAQHLDALDIEQRIVEISRVRLVNPVYEQADAGLHRLHQRHPDSADRHECTAAAVAVDVEPRRQHRGFADRIDPARGQRIAIDRGHRDRHIGQCFVALTCGHDDDAVVLIFGGARSGRLLRMGRCRGEHGRQHGGGNGKIQLGHQTSPNTAVLAARRNLSDSFSTYMKGRRLCRSADGVCRAWVAHAVIASLRSQ